MIGMATYGQSFRLANVANNGVGAPTSSIDPPPGEFTKQSGMYAYYEVSCHNIYKQTDYDHQVTCNRPFIPEGFQIDVNIFAFLLSYGCD